MVLHGSFWAMRQFIPPLMICTYKPNAFYKDRYICFLFQLLRNIKFLRHKEQATASLMPVYVVNGSGTYGESQAGHQRYHFTASYPKLHSFLDAILLMCLCLFVKDNHLLGDLLNATLGDRHKPDIFCDDDTIYKVAYTVPRVPHVHEQSLRCCFDDRLHIQSCASVLQNEVQNRRITQEETSWVRFCMAETTIFCQQGRPTE